MKKIFCCIAVLFIVGVASAQTDSSMQDTSGMRMMHDSMMQGGMKGMQGGMMGKMKDCVMMHDGKPMVMKGGQHMPLTQQMNFPNGSSVMPDGTMKMPDGATHMLKDGDCVYMDGTMGKMPMMKGKMKMGKDSTKM